MTEATPVYRWQTFPGENYFWCNGRIMLGSTPYHLLATICMIVVPYIGYCMWVAPQQASLWRLIGLFGFFLPCMYNLIASALVEPGILPRHPVGLYPPSQEHTRDVTGVELKFCPVCNFWRPRRVKHCRLCKNCVEEFDHHCPWVGNCIGKRNYPYFARFVFFVTALSAYISTCSILLLHHDVELTLQPHWYLTLETIARKRFPLLLISIYCVAMFLSLLGLLFNHLYLIYNAQTTNEQIWRKYANAQNPYDQGCFGNYQQRFFRWSLPPSRLDDLQELCNDAQSSLTTLTTLSAPTPPTTLTGLNEHTPLLIHAQISKPNSSSTFFH